MNVDSCQQNWKFQNLMSQGRTVRYH